MKKKKQSIFEQPILFKTTEPPNAIPLKAWLKYVKAGSQYSRFTNSTDISKISTYETSTQN